MLAPIAFHRSIRRFENRAIPAHVMETVLAAAVRASTVGTMQLYSIVVSQSKDMLAKLAPLHFNQPAAATAPAIVTFCVDVARFSQWCRARNAEPSYNNFAWFINGSIDALLASQNFALEAENQSLGICYLGTTLYTAREICELLELPQGVVPITAIAIGYPDENPPLTPRLPLSGVVHYEKYKPYSETDINQIYNDTEASELTKTLVKDNKTENLAQIFTHKRYVKSDNEKYSKLFFELLIEQKLLSL